MDTFKVLRLLRNMEIIFGKRCKNMAPVTKRFWTRSETCWNVTKCLLTKRCYATFETSKSDHVCRTHHRHGHIALTAVTRGWLQTVDDGCGHKSSVERTRLNPQTHKVKRESFATHSGKKDEWKTHSKSGSIKKQFSRWKLRMNQSQACQELATLKLYIVAAPGCPNRLPPCFETRRSSD